MRTDVKAGMIIAMVVVLVAGGYYTFRDRDAAPVPVIGNQLALSKKPSRQQIQPTRQARKNQTEKNGKKTFSNKRPKSDQAGKMVKKSSSKRLPAQAVTKRSVPSNTGKQTAAPSTGGKTLKSPPSVAKGHPGANTINPSAGLIREDAKTKRATPVELTARLGLNPVGATGRPSRQLDVSSAQVETHWVQPGDTLSSIAQNYYGSTKFVPFLAKSNPQITDLHRLDVGAKVKIPPRPKDMAVAKTTTPSSGQASGQSVAQPGTYTVKSGDSFYRIALRELGNASRWEEIFELNKDLVHGEPTRLRVGHVLVLPAK